MKIKLYTPRTHKPSEIVRKPPHSNTLISVATGVVGVEGMVFEVEVVTVVDVADGCSVNVVADVDVVVLDMDVVDVVLVDHVVENSFISPYTVSIIRVQKMFKSYIQNLESYNPYDMDMKIPELNYILSTLSVSSGINSGGITTSSVSDRSITTGRSIRLSVVGLLLSRAL